MRGPNVRIGLNISVQWKYTLLGTREKIFYIEDIIEEKENRGYIIQLITFPLPNSGEFQSYIILMVSPLTQKPPKICFFSTSPPAESIQLPVSLMSAILF